MKYCDAIFTSFLKVLCHEKRTLSISPSFSFNNMFEGGKASEDSRVQLHACFLKQQLFVERVCITLFCLLMSSLKTEIAVWANKRLQRILRH